MAAVPVLAVKRRSDPGPPISFRDSLLTEPDEYNIAISYGGLTKVV